jgi:RNA polymerase sigma-70 factor (ECF subfamily)
MRCARTISAPAAIRKPSAKAISDEALIASIAAHDKNAMHVLFVRHQVRVFRFLTRLLGDAVAAEDLVSETFIEIWRHAAQFESRAKASTWILGIARHKAASARRQRSFARLEDGAIELIKDPDDDPEMVAQKSKRNALLRECLQRLSPAHREILDLIYYHEQSIAAAALIVGVPANTVKTRAHNARRRVAQLMAARGVQGAWH